ncbi:MAG: hypothetical protein JWO65_2307 [Sphingomonas bacterium]|nr:hypothetical protein [Sphingomonas bacterium]
MLRSPAIATQYPGDSCRSAVHRLYMTIITIAAEALLQAIQAQTHKRGPPPAVYRDEGDLRDVQFAGQIDILAAMRAAFTAMSDSSEAMEEAGSRYVDASKHVSVDGIWSTMIEAALAE